MIFSYLLTVTLGRLAGVHNADAGLDWPEVGLDSDASNLTDRF